MLLIIKSFAKEKKQNWHFFFYLQNKFWQLSNVKFKLLKLSNLYVNVTVVISSIFKNFIDYYYILLPLFDVVSGKLRLRHWKRCFCESLDIEIPRFKLG